MFGFGLLHLYESSILEYVAGIPFPPGRHSLTNWIELFVPYKPFFVTIRFLR